MADTVALANWADFLSEEMLAHQLTFGHEHVLLSELTGMVNSSEDPPTRDPNNGRATAETNNHNATFHGGSKFTVPLQLGDVSAQSVAEGGTFAEPVAFSTDQANYNLKSLIAPIGLTLEVERDAKKGSQVALNVVSGLIDSAYRATARRDNDFLHGNATGLLAAVSANTGSGSLDVYVSASTTNFDQLTPGRIVDVLTRTTGADPGNGNRRKIASVNRTTGVVTFSTTAVASDGDSGNITHSTTDGIYIDGSWASASTGNTPAGLGNVLSTTDTTYGNIDKTAVAQWQGIAVDGASGILSDDLFDTALISLRGNGIGAPDFAIAHPATVNPYKNSMASMVKVDMQTTTVKSGFKGIICQAGDKEFPVLKDINAPRKVCRGVTKSSMKVYGDGNAPGFIDDDGSMWRFPGRNTKKEAALYDRWQLGARDCGKNFAITSLSES